MLNDTSITLRPGKGGLQVSIKTSPQLENWMRRNFGGRVSLDGSGQLWGYHRLDKKPLWCYPNCPRLLNREQFGQFEHPLGGLTILQFEGIGEGLRLVFPKEIYSQDELKTVGNNLSHSIKEFARFMESFKEVG